jgi:hypothetical protein
MITDNNILSIWTDKITDGINYVGNYYQQNHSVGNAVGIRWISGSVFTYGLFYIIKIDRVFLILDFKC